MPHCCKRDHGKHLLDCTGHVYISVYRDALLLSACQMFSRSKLQLLLLFRHVRTRFLRIFKELFSTAAFMPPPKPTIAAILMQKSKNKKVKASKLHTLKKPDFMN